MSDLIICEKEKLIEIADAIRAKTGSSEPIGFPSEFAPAIEGITASDGGSGGGVIYAPNLVAIDVPVVVRTSAQGEDVLFSYNVVSVSGASYGFSGSPTSGTMGENTVVGGNNYYQSNNHKISSSYAICKVNFYSSEERTVTLNCISYGESNFDYGLISTINHTLSLSVDDDGATGSEAVTKNFKGLSSAAVVPVNITVPAGDSFITIKYRKDSSGDSGDDRFKFSVVL